ncbi:hypothetical protein SUGI_0734370, partial [Cryptomeria japonica]
MGKNWKWKEIMVLEVQDGGEGLRHFCSRDIQWTPICVKNDSTIGLCATIPLDRLDAFMRGNRCAKVLKPNSSESGIDVINAVTRVCSIQSRKHVHDATSILEWKKQDEANFFFFQQPQGADRPFVMGIQTTWMLDMMVQFSHDSIISMDSTFAKNKYGYQLYSCLVFDEQQLGVPVAWAMTSRNKIEDIQVWLMELRRRGKEKRPDWRINAFIMDDASAEIQAIQTVFESHVILCIWHVRRAWLKNVY